MPDSSPITHHSSLSAILPDNASIKIIGLGGVGGIIARYLAMFCAAMAWRLRLVFIDGDAFEPSNATRMFFSRHGNKAAVIREDLLDRFKDTGLTLVAIEEYITPENISRLIRTGDIVLLAVDNHATRKLVNDHCAGLADICLVSGGNDGVGEDGSGQFRKGTFGNCQIYVRRNGADATPSLSRYHPEIANPADQMPGDKSCTELIASVPQILFANLMTAASCLNALWLYLCGQLHYAELCFDIADGKMGPIPLPIKAELLGRK